MKKRRVTLNLDSEVVDALEAIEASSTSAAANDALRRALASDAHRAALSRWLDELDAAHGAASAAEIASAEAVVAELEMSSSRSNAA